MAVVKTMNIGGATVIVHDDYYKDKTRKEVLDTLDRVARIACPYIVAKSKDKTA